MPGLGLHGFRHTCATMLFREGRNAKQVQTGLGHHSPAFTSETYVHLLPEDLPEPPSLGRRPQRATTLASSLHAVVGSAARAEALGPSG